ncbi:MAG: methyltransferase, partial [Humidesulfovibrio sp.]|nr:methyltransferase [Humidesulfovibrio sp.]
MPDAAADACSPGALCHGLLEAEVAGRVWRLSRPADLESLWAAMGEGGLDDDERLPYWVELWPAAVLLARWVAR